VPTSAVSENAATSRSKKTAAKKGAPRTRRSAVKKVDADVKDSAVGQSRQMISGRPVESLALITLALVFGVIGLAVHVLWIVSIIFMAMQFGLIASELGNRRGRGVVSEVVHEVATVVEEVKSGDSSSSGDVKAEVDQPHESGQGNGEA
jgi:Flp pilus assembly protein TadB